MSLRHHAVVVEPRRWNRPILELARLLVPVTGAEAGALAQVLERGPMTVESDLSERDAAALVRRLQAMGIPASLEDVVAEPEPPRERKGTPAPMMPLDELLASLPEESQATDVARRTMMSLKPMAATSGSGSGWGEVFPDLAEPSDPSVPSLDELESEADEEALPPSLVADSKRDTLPPELATAAAAEARASLEDVPPPQIPSRPASVTPPGLPSSPEPESGRAPKQPRSSGPPRQPKSREFAAAPIMADLIGEPTERPPYEPTGFDSRPEHLPGVAALLSGLAPGAGQIFNGDADEALGYGLKFFLVKPWIDSVRDARTKAEKIRTYWAPRPDPGAFGGAVRYVVAFWVCVSLLVVIVGWFGNRVYTLATREAEAPDRSGAVAAAVNDARMGTLAARVAALDDLTVAEREVSSPQFTMDEEERAERLFILGYQECKARSYKSCESMMKRVSELQPNPRALKLQAWASVQHRQSGGERQPMPDVGEVPTLSEWEIDAMRDEMVIEGEDVPPPRPPQPETAPDAGADE